MDMHQQEVPNILFCLNSNQEKPMVTAIVSMLKSLKTQEKVNIFVIYGDHESCPNKTLEEKLNLLNLFSKIETLEFISIPSEKVRIFDSTGRAFPHYYKILGLELLSKRSIEKVIYLDNDVLVRDSILSLWKEDVETCAIAAVRSTSNYSDKIRIRKIIDKEKLPLRVAIESEWFCINSGVLILNSSLWIKEEIFNKLKKYSHIKGLLNFDQDLFNLVLLGKVKELDSIWNYLKTVDGFFLYELDKEDNQRSCSFEPKIVHFAGTLKPWLEKYKGKYFKEYDEIYLNLLNFSRTPYYYFSKFQYRLRNPLAMKLLTFSFFNFHREIYKLSHSRLKSNFTLFGLLVTSFRLIKKVMASILIFFEIKLKRYDSAPFIEKIRID